MTKSKAKKAKVTEFRCFTCKLDNEARRNMKVLTGRPGSGGQGAVVRALLAEAVAPILLAAEKGKTLAARTRKAAKEERPAVQPA